MKKCLGLLIALCLFASAQAMNIEDFEKNLTVHTLKNGMTFLLYERHDAPVVSFHTYVDTGSVNEEPGITGISHMLEHMAFKGTKTIGTKDLEKELVVMEKIDDKFLKLYDLLDNNGSEDEIKSLRAEIEKLQEEAESYAEIGEFDQIITRAGSPDLNAGTSADSTQYPYSLPSNKVELFMLMESERFFNPVFRQFYKERDVVAEERRMRTESSPIGKLIEQFQLMSFTYHPYHIPTIGAMSDIQRYTRDKVEDYYKRRYNPHTMTIAVVGDFETKEVIEMAEKYFGRIPAGEKPQDVVTVEPQQTVERHMVLEENSQPIYLEGYHRPAATSEEAPALDALAMILGQGRTSRLYKRMVNEDKIAMQVGVFSGYPGDKYPCLTMVFGVANSGYSNDDLAEVIHEEIEKIKKEPVTEEELNMVKAQNKASLIYGLRSNRGIARALTTYQVKYGDWRELFKSVEKIEKLTTEDIQKVAKKYLVKSNRNVGEIIPKKN